MAHHRFKTIIFDLDGTLIDSLTDIAAAANTVLEELGFPQHPQNSYLNFVGDGLLTLATRMVPAGTSENQVKAVANRFRTIYMDCWAHNSYPYPGILKMLETISQHPVNLAVLSNKPDDFTQLFVNRFFPEKMFGQVLGNRQGVPKKPDPTAALAIADFFGSFPNALEEEDIVTEIQVSAPRDEARQTFVKFRLREAIDFALVSVASVASVKNGICQDARIVLGAVAPRPLRAIAAENVLIGQALNDKQAAAAAETALEGSLPLEKNSYKIPIAREMVQRAIANLGTFGK